MTLYYRPLGCNVNRTDVKCSKRSPMLLVDLHVEDCIAQEDH